MIHDEEITVLDLFSGIGGFSLGLESAGPFRTVAFCEREPFPQAVLRKHWPNVPIYDDVRTIDADGLGRIDIIAGGFPCQPWSQAGEQRGAADDRDLWPEMARLVGELRPKYLIGENVRGFINQPMGLERSLFDLESLGYQAVPFIVPACAVDAPHRRDRVWIIAHSSVADASVQPTRGAQRGEHNKGRRPDASRSSEIVADAGNARLQGREQRQTFGESERASRPVAQRGENGGSQRWPTEPDVGRVAHGVPNRVDRLKALGNAVVPQVVAQIGKAIVQAECGG